jgi:alkylated DNA repair dioxygenase AlkB
MTVGNRIWLDPESWVDYADDYLDSSHADRLFDWTDAQVDWEDRGDTRLLAWYGSFAYQYPGVSHSPREVPSTLDEFCVRLAKEYRQEAPNGFDGILLNRYDSGDNFVDFHADDEPSLAANHPVALISVGAPRVLVFRSTTRTVSPGYAFTLKHGSLLVTGGLTQSRWHHGVPVEPQANGLRISLTFRKGR